MSLARQHGWAVLLSASVLWTVGALRKSLWTDEFHSLHHTRARSFGELLEIVRSDNHPPLSFALQRLSVSAFGESELALRLPSIVAGLLLLVVLLGFAQRLPGRSAPLVVSCLAVLSSFLFMVCTEARMYSWLALSVLGLTGAVLGTLEGRTGRWWVSPWVVLGFHTHYYFVHDAFVLALCVVVSAVLWPGSRERALGLLLPAGVAALACLPWVCFGLASQLFHDLPPGGHKSGAGAWLESLAHLAFMNSSLGGGFLTYGVALPGALVVGWLACAGVARLALEDRDRRLLLFLAGLGVGVPAWSYLVSLLVPRASYGWPYLAGSAVPLLCLVAVGIAGSGVRWVLGALACGTLLGVTLTGAIWGGTEDWRRATEVVLSSAQPGDGLVAKPLWQPEDARSPTGWDYYAERLDLRRSRRLAVIPTGELARAGEHARVWLLTRDEHSPWILRALRKRFRGERLWRFGTRLEVRLFSEPRGVTGA